MGLIKTLRDMEPFNHLPDDVFIDLEDAAEIRTFPAHIHIFNQHDPPTGYLYIVKEGLVEIVVLTPGGVEMVVDYRRDGSFFGGTPVFTNEDYTAGARTVRKTDCYLVPAELLTRVARDYPQISTFFTRAIFSRVRSLYSEMVRDHGDRALTQIEAYPFKKRLSEIMTTPVETCSPSTPVKQVARRMTQKGISAMLVNIDDEPPIGIISERELVAKVLARDDIECESAVAADIMTEMPETMAPSTYMYEATSFMMTRRIKHLPIVDAGRLVGIVTLKDLMRFRSQKTMLLVGSVREAGSVEELATVQAQIVKVANALLGETRSPFETMEILSYIHHCVMRRCYEIVLDEMKQQGLKPPDIRYCLIIMGSGGRKEMLLGPDQDNGFLFENFPDDKTEEVESFFVPFSERLVEAFANVGYPRCNGEVMVNNPLWRGRLDDWHERIARWVSAPEPKRVMNSTIFLDFMPLVGDPSLCQDLRDILHMEVRNNPSYLFHLLENNLKHKPPLNILGRFTPERSGEHKGEISLKQSGSVFIVDCVRMFMLEEGVDAVTTIERIDKLVELKVFHKETAEHIKAAMEAFTFLRLRNEIALIEQGKEPSHYIAPNSLTKKEQDLLKEAFRAAGKLQDSTRRHFGQGIL